MSFSSSSMWVSIPWILFFSSFCLSSVWSISSPQKAFLASSSVCSFFRFFTMSSINLVTFSNPPFFPRSAITIKSSAGLLWAFDAPSSTARALACSARLLPTCSRELGPGRVFLNSSRASSLLRTLMVSAMARSSSARVAFTSSYSLALVLQFLDSSSEYPVSSSSWVWVSSRSFLRVVSFTLISPARSVFSSMASVAAAISFFLAATSSSKFLADSVSVPVISSRVFSFSSFMVLRIPTTSPLEGWDAVPWKKAVTVALSSSLRSCIFPIADSTVEASGVCRNPIIPFSIAGMALPRASIIPLMLAESSWKAWFSFLRWEVASPMLCLAASRSSLCCCSSLMV
mmetsp:Transcript_33141/g.79917  ORF Transcript_33141/g.79917 Transcript_33141/m.79917 type:complete len:344 (+) Transcript_33141:750-1781(+)